MYTTQEECAGVDGDYGPGGVGTNKCEWYGTCLLYTSDAADE